MNSVNYKRLEKSLTDVIQEAQLKIGYDHHPITLYYPTESVARLLGTPEEDADSTERALRRIIRRLGSKSPYKHEKRTLKERPFCFCGFTEQLQYQPSGPCPSRTGCRSRTGLRSARPQSVHCRHHPMYRCSEQSARQPADSPWCYHR